MDIKNIIDYLKVKVPNFTSQIKKTSYLFTCPNIKNHGFSGDAPTATFINGTDKIHCLQCDIKLNIYQVVKLLEPDKKDWEDSKITNYLLGVCNIDMYSELVQYEKYGWFLFPLEPNSKAPVEKQSWKKVSTQDKLQWIGWLEKGYNIAVNCELSKIFVVGIDVKDLDKLSEEQKIKRNEILDLLDKTKTLIQNSASGGKHYIFNPVDCFGNWANIGGIQIDIRTVGGQSVIQPSKYLGKEYRWYNIGDKIKDLPEDLKTLLLELPKNKLEAVKFESIDAPKISTLDAGEGRNNNLTSIGGIIINKFPDKPEIAEWFMQLINQKFHNPPLSNFEVKNIAQSLKGYKNIEGLTQKEAVLGYMRQMNIPINTKDILENLPGIKLNSALVNKYFSELAKDGVIVHWSRGYYKIKELLEWTTQYPKKGRVYEYKMPYFNHLMEFESSDILLLGGMPGGGKSHIAINMLKQMIDQGCKPYYVSLESGSRYGKIAEKLGLVDSKDSLKFYIKEHNNPLNISLVENAFTVIDWLNINEFEKTAQVHEYFKNEMQNKGGILVIFTQLKKGGREGEGAYDFFAPNLAEQFPSFTAKYAFDNTDRTEGHWQVSKLRDPRGNFWNARVDCEYNPETKLFTAKGV